MKKLKRVVVSILLTSICLMSFTSCMKKEERKEVLRVAMEIGYPPFEYYDADGTTPIGLDVELANAIGDELEMEVQLINTAWDGIFDGLSKGNYDCIISAATITPERLVDFEFSTPYMKSHQSIVSLKSGNVKPRNPLECEGIRIGYQEETTSDIFITKYANDNEIEIETYAYAKVVDCFSDLKRGKLDAVICDSTLAVGYTFEEESIYEITWVQDKDIPPEEFAICVNKSDVELLEKINGALKTLEENGKLQEITSKYF